MLQIKNSYCCIGFAYSGAQNLQNIIYLFFF